jgi:hypothetical protein
VVRAIRPIVLRAMLGLWSLRLDFGGFIGGGAKIFLKLKPLSKFLATPASIILQRQRYSQKVRALRTVRVQRVITSSAYSATVS